MAIQNSNAPAWHRLITAVEDIPPYEEDGIVVPVEYYDMPLDRIIRALQRCRPADLTYAVKLLGDRLTPVEVKALHLAYWRANVMPEDGFVPDLYFTNRDRAWRLMESAGTDREFAFACWADLWVETAFH